MYCTQKGSLLKFLAEVLTCKFFRILSKWSWEASSHTHDYGHYLHFHCTCGLSFTQYSYVFHYIFRLNFQYIFIRDFFTCHYYFSSQRRRIGLSYTQLLCCDSGANYLMRVAIYRIKKWILLYIGKFFSCLYSPSEARRHYWVFGITLRHITLGRTPGRVISSIQRPLHENTHSQETDIHVHGGIRTRNPSKRAAAVPRHFLT